MTIAENIKFIKTSIPNNVTLVAVSKTKPNSDILEAYTAGHRIFGENKVQDLTQKHADLPKDIEWHFIGHLQTNKIKYIAPFVSLIHGVDSQKLLVSIHKEGVKNKRKIKCLLQIHIAKESTKFGFNDEELANMLHSNIINDLCNVEICGVMGMATNTNNKNEVAEEFSYLKKIFSDLKKDFFLQQESFSQISMGMSNDYSIAIEQGSTMIRVGSSIFGQRNYH